MHERVTMPALQTLVGALNQKFSIDELQNLPLDLFEPQRPLSEALDQLGVGGRLEGLTAYLNSLPPALHEAIKASVRSALERNPRSPVTFAWAPGYDFELTIWDVAATPATPGGVTILLKSPYAASPGAANKA
jgi:hypothetical protein